MEEYQVQRATILGHLNQYVLDGNTLRDPDEFIHMLELPGEQQAIALEAFARLGDSQLKPVFEQLGGTVNYEDLKILRLIYRSKKVG